MAKTIKNYGRSVKERLLNISRAEKYSSQLLISRYFQERLLYRLSVSDYKDKFILKGGALLYAHDGFQATFANRGTDYKKNHPLFSEDFFNDSNRLLYWKGFLKRIKYSKQLSFTDVGTLIRTHLQPYWDQLRSKNTCNKDV